MAGARQRNFSHGAVQPDYTAVIPRAFLASDPQVLRRQFSFANLILVRPHASLRPKSTGAADIGAAPRHVLSANNIGIGRAGRGAHEACDGGGFERRY